MARRTQQRGRYFEGLRVVNRTQVAVAVAGLALLMTWGLPRFYPTAMQGPACANLAPPIGGNNRSVLAYRSEQIGAVDLDLSMESTAFTSGEALRLRITFKNNDRGPIVLNLPRLDPVITVDRTAQGVSLELTSVTGAVPIASQPAAFIPPAAFVDTSTLHLLSSRTRCHYDITLPYSTLAGLGLQPGQEYRVRAFYRNNSDGDLRAVTPLNATATPFPEYADSQGVWVGEASSEEVRFSVVP